MSSEFKGDNEENKVIPTYVEVSLQVGVFSLSKRYHLLFLIH